MFQLSFLNTGLLIFAAATVLPLLIWLLAKRKPKQIVFSSLRFLKLSKDQEKKRTKLRNIILLIIRMLIILLLVLAVARPMFRSAGLRPSKKHPPTALAIILDSSYSMDFVVGTKSLLEHAKLVVKEINRRATSSDRLILISSDTAWNRLHSQIFPKAIPEDLLDGIEITHIPEKPQNLFKLAERKLAETQYPNREIYLITDGQKQDYPANTTYPIHIIPLPVNEQFSNLAVSEVRPIPQLTQHTRQHTLEFRLSNYGKSERKDVLLKVVINGVKTAEKFVSIPPRHSQTERIVTELRQDGWQTGYVEVLDDKLMSDNRAYFAFPYYLNPRVAVISDTGSIPSYLRSILAVYTGSSSPNIIHPSSVNNLALKDYNLLVVNNVTLINDKLRELLQSAQSGEKGILYTMGSNLSSDYKAHLESTFGTRIGAYQREAKSIDFVNPHHYISSIVSEHPIRNKAVNAYYPASSGASSLISASGEALLMVKDQAVLCLFDLSSIQNRFMLDPAFPVLITRSLQYLSRTRSGEQSYSLGDIVRADAITVPDEKRLELAQRSFVLSEPGIHILHKADDEAIAVNPDPREGNFSPMDFTFSRDYRHLGKNWQNKLFGSRLGYELWKYLLLTAFLLMILEIIIVKLEEARPNRTEQ